MKENGKVPVQDFLYSLNPKLRAKAFSDIELLKRLGTELKEPYVKPIKGKKNKGLYRLRVGDYTIIYSVDNGKLIVYVVDAGNRGDIYKRYKQGAIKITVRDQIKAACDVAGLSATELGAKMGMSQQTFSSRLKVGKFSKSEYEQMAEILGAKFIFRFEFPDGTRI